MLPLEWIGLDLNQQNNSAVPRASSLVQLEKSPATLVNRNSAPVIVSAIDHTASAVYWDYVLWRK